MLVINGLIQALPAIRKDVIRATADGYIDKGEALTIFRDLALALIHEGLQVGLSIAQKKLE